MRQNGERIFYVEKIFMAIVMKPSVTVFILERIKATAKSAITALTAARSLLPSTDKLVNECHEKIADALQSVGEYAAAVRHFGRVPYGFCVMYPEGSYEIFTATLKWLSCVALADQGRASSDAKISKEVFHFSVAAANLLDQESRNFLGVQFLPVRLQQFFREKAETFPLPETLSTAKTLKEFFFFFEEFLDSDTKINQSINQYSSFVAGATC